MLTFRLFLLVIMVDLACSAERVVAQDAGDNSLKMIDLFNASTNEDVACYRIPALVTAGNGDLLAAIDERVPSCGDLKWSGNINIVLRRSIDHGETWLPIETLVDFPEGQSASDPSMIVDQMTGAIFLFYNYMDLERERDVYYLHMIKSEDNGLTWSEPIDLTEQITLPEWKDDFKFITSGRGMQTAGGKLVHCLVNLNNGMHLFASDDHGESWYLLETPIRPADESKVIELTDRAWMVNARVNDKKGSRYIHISRDEGKSWESFRSPELTDPGCNASIIRYSSVASGGEKDRILFANANSSSGRQNMTVRISYDEGQTWSAGKTIYSGLSAYSSLTVLANGDIGLFFEKDDYTKNVFVKFSLSWLTDGMDSN